MAKAEFQYFPLLDFQIRHLKGRHIPKPNPKEIPKEKLLKIEKLISFSFFYFTAPKPKNNHSAVENSEFFIFKI